MPPERQSLELPGSDRVRAVRPALVAADGVIAPRGGRYVVGRIAAALIVALALAGGGCSDRDGQRYTPTVDQAQLALTAVLDAWRSGQPVATIPGAAVQVADTQRRPGQKLRSYAILGELPADSGRRFQVKLQLEQPTAEIKAQFVIVGIDPLWVFRQEDYDMLTHWDHPMPTTGAAKALEKSTSTAPRPRL